MPSTTTTTTAKIDTKKRQPVKNSPGLFKYSTKHGKDRFGVRYRDHLNRSTEKMGFERVLDARKFQKENSEKLEHGDYVSPADGKITLDELKDLYLESKEVSWAETYKVVWASRWRARVTAELGHLQVRHITAPILQRWVNKLVSGAGLSSDYWLFTDNSGSPAC